MLKTFVPSLVDTEEKMMQKFVLGLNPKTRRMVETFNPKTIKSWKNLEEKNPEPIVAVGKKRAYKT